MNFETTGKHDKTTDRDRCGHMMTFLNCPVWFCAYEGQRHFCKLLILAVYLCMFRVRALILIKNACTHTYTQTHMYTRAFNHMHK